ncbi:SET and MYND domain-containing protein DDB_G0273589 [Tetranychus urticae]|uniref:Protein-lysine N-methyltransferase SMYD4 n=1 Tax=Tetranychus urticae TaxID=32264 RepID=T1K809_TETUR|nr:SET and MYND domain-containing protein DDB_G0273589 [Tetranychus urticae]
MTSFIEDFEKLRITLQDRMSNTPNRGPQLDWNTFPTWSTRFVVSFSNPLELAENPAQLIQKIADAASTKDRVDLLLNNRLMKQKMEEAVKKAMDYVNSNESSQNAKNLTESRQFMKQGSELLKQNKVKEALECFNRGIACSPFPQENEATPGQTNLAMCLVKRSRFHQSLKKYPESWLDMKDAIEFMPDPRLKEELLRSKRNLMVEIASKDGRQPVDPDVAEMDFESWDINLKPENRNLHGAIESLELRWSEEKGRCIRTTRPLRPNTNIIAELPYAAWLQPTHYEFYCAYCLKPLDYRSFPCRQCKMISYCSSKCSEAAWTSYHSKECKYLPVLRHLAMGHLALKILLITGFDEAIEIHRNPPPASRHQRKFLNTFRDVYTLMDSPHVFDAPKLTSFTACAVFMALLTHAMGLIEEQQIDVIADIYLKLIDQIVLNGLAIYDDRGLDSQGIWSYNSSGVSKKIGIGLYATTSLLSHSCNANCDRIFIGSKVVISTKKVISKDSEITISYGPSMVQGYKARRKDIKENYYFDCLCDVCKTKQ